MRKTNIKNLKDLQISWTDLQLVQRRQKKKVLREVYLAGENYVFKRYLFKAKPIFYLTKPWEVEANALRHSDGLPVPKHIATYAGIGQDGLQEFVLHRTLIPGDKIDHLNDQSVEGMAEVLAAIHCRGVVTRDATIQNFIISGEGKICFIDFGKARIHHLPSFYDIGSELARFFHGTLFYDLGLWAKFINHYYELRPVGPITKMLEQSFCTFCKQNRKRTIKKKSLHFG